ncbi:dienelactone hydrolase family protein [Luteococcus sp.]|uniref:dienelactone hydrolase family protein n=1 Tax=Luteococcus sp. TaxID=1969402 RepID=UPI003736FA7B
MTKVVLFHHVLGLTPGVSVLADQLRTGGHTVETPDLFAGQTFTDIAAGLAHVNELGEAELLSRAEQACAGLPTGVVYAGLSLGVVPAQHLLQTRAGAAGAVLLHSFIPPHQVAGQWPSNCPVELYGTDADSFFVADGDLDAARDWQVNHPNLHLHLYPGSGHLFLEPGMPDHDPELAWTVTRDILAALAGMN